MQKEKINSHFEFFSKIGKTLLKPFSGFSNLKNNFQPIIVLTPLQIERKKLEDKVDALLENKFLDTVMEYYFNGYVLNKQQENLFYKQIHELHNNQIMRFLDKKIIHGLPVNDSELLYFIHEFSHTTFNYQETNDKNEVIMVNSKITQLYKQRLAHPDFQALILERWVSELSTFKPGNIENDEKKIKMESKRFNNLIHSPLFKYGNYFLKSLNFEATIAITQQLNQLYNDSEKNKSRLQSTVEIYLFSSKIKQVLNQFKTLSQVLLNNDVQKTKKTIQVLYSENHLNQTIVEEAVKLGATHNIKTLPSEATVILENIKNDYINIQQNNQLLSHEQNFTLDNIWNKRVPDIINKYLRVDEEYRISMKNVDNKNAEQLMLESLSNIHQILVVEISSP